MNLAEFYETIGGNYKDVRLRLPSDALVYRFTMKFLDDKSYEKLRAAIQAGDNENAFREAHTLRGVAQNLSFERLAGSVGELTELLRNWAKENIDANEVQRLWKQVSGDYAVIIEAAKSLSLE